MQVLFPSNTPFHMLSISSVIFLTALEAARYLIFFFVSQCKQIDIRKFPYCVMQTLPVVFSTEVRYLISWGRKWNTDSQRASQLLNHLGRSAKKFCRFCMVSEVESIYFVWH